MNRSEILSSAKNKEIVYLLGRYVQDNGQDVQNTNEDADVENVKYGIIKLAFSYVLVTAYDTVIWFFIIYLYLSDRKNNIKFTF